MATKLCDNLSFMQSGDKNLQIYSLFRSNLHKISNFITRKLGKTQNEAFDEKRAIKSTEK